MFETGIIAKSEEIDLMLGFVQETPTRLVFKPSLNPPSFHDCLAKQEIIKFWDVDVQVKGQESYMIFNVQELSNGDALYLDSTWNEKIQGSNSEIKKLRFEAKAVKVGFAASKIIDLIFPFFKHQMCIINAGSISIEG